MTKLTQKLKNKTWIKSTLSKMAIINPVESIPKGKLCKYVSMDCIKSFTRKISNYEFKEFSGGMKFRNGDVLLARITPCLENGKTAFVDILENDEVGFGSTEYIVIREKKDISDKRFLYYLATSPSFRENAIKLMTGTSGRQRVQTSSLVETEFYFPPLSEQKEIANILSSLDDKIELLQEQNKVLEETAQTIFKEWFGKYSVDRPDELPEGWRVGNIGEEGFCEIISSGIEKFDNEKIYIATADVENDNITNISTLINFKSRPDRANMQPIIESVWFAKMKDSRKVLSFHTFSNREINRFILSTGFMGLKTNNISHYYISCFVFSKKFDVIKNKIAHGAVQIAINNENLRKVKFIIPSESILSNFNDLVHPIFYKIYKNKFQIDKLNHLKNTLLPKLINGNINI